MVAEVVGVDLYKTRQVLVDGSDWFVPGKLYKVEKGTAFIVGDTNISSYSYHVKEGDIFLFLKYEIRNQRKIVEFFFDDKIMVRYNDTTLHAWFTEYDI